MEHQRNPLQITVSLVANNGPVRVINTAAYIYRRSAIFRANDVTKPNYWRPHGEYFVRYAGLTFPVTCVGNGFRTRITFADYLQMLQYSKERKSNGSSNQQVQA